MGADVPADLDDALYASSVYGGAGCRIGEMTG